MAKEKITNVNLAAGLSYKTKGLSVIPTKPTSKKPAIPSWKNYQKELPTPEELTEWFSQNGRALGIICGRVSGNLECLDFDFEAELFQPWTSLVEETMPGLLARLVIQKTQNGGRHVIYRCSEGNISGNQALAQIAIQSSDAQEIEYHNKTVKPIKVGSEYYGVFTLIETRGEGGYFLAYPSPRYELVQGNIREIPDITPEERSCLLQAAQALNTWVRPSDRIDGQVPRKSKTISGKRPGDDFNERADLEVLLQRHGWKPVKRNGDYRHYRRPGKSRGQSASIIADRLFFCFSNNAPPFEAGKAYTPFAVYTLLEHKGNFQGAAAELAKQGYGEQGKSAESAAAVLADKGLAAGPYCVSDGCLTLLKATKDGSVPVKLCNFYARIRREVVRDDGAEPQIFYEIEGSLADGRPLPPVMVPAPQFGSLNWVPGVWGTQSIVAAGQSTKDHLRVAIQSISAFSVKREWIFTHLGWRKIDGQWFYLHGKGAIGESGPGAGVTVEPEGALKSYILPDPPPDPAGAVRASLETLELGKPEQTFPLLAAVYRAPLDEVTKCAGSLFLVGRTGAQKSSLAAIAQGHWGTSFNYNSLPGNWESTANSLEKVQFSAKDAILVVDDYCPRGGRQDLAALDRTANRVFRGKSNSAARSRMRPDGSLRPDYQPRSLVVGTGEDVPKGGSLMARMLIITFKPGCVDLQRLTKAQANSREGRLAEAMSAYVQWLAPQVEDLKKEFPNRVQQLRDELRRQSWAHDQTPSILADLLVGFEQFLKFAVDMKAVDSERAEELWEKGFQALLQLGRQQAEHLRHEDPVTRFIHLLQAVLASGRGHVANAVTSEHPDPPNNPADWGWRFIKRDDTKGYWQSMGHKLGWVDDDYLYLSPDTVFAAVQELARIQGGQLPITQQTLWRRLKEEKLLVITDKDRNTHKKTIEGRRQRVLALEKSCIICSEKRGKRGNGGVAKKYPENIGPDYEKSPNNRGRDWGATLPDEAARPEKRHAYPGVRENRGENKTDKSNNCPDCPDCPDSRGIPIQSYFNFEEGEL